MVAAAVIDRSFHQKRDIWSSYGLFCRSIFILFSLNIYLTFVWENWLAKKSGWNVQFRRMLLNLFRLFNYQMNTIYLFIFFILSRRINIKISIRFQVFPKKFHLWNRRKKKFINKTENIVPVFKELRMESCFHNIYSFFHYNSMKCVIPTRAFNTNYSFSIIPVYQLVRHSQSVSIHRNKTPHFTFSRNNLSVGVWLMYVCERVENNVSIKANHTYKKKVSVKRQRTHNNNKQKKRTRKRVWRF